MDIHLSTQRWEKLVCDESGKVVLFQSPNLPLLGWILCTVLKVFVPLGRLAGTAGFLGSAFLFTWAYLELTEGTTYLRRGLGLVVIIGIIGSQLQR